MMATRALDAVSVGGLVPPILERHVSATVLAVFERSVYLETGAELIAIVDASLHDGPLTIKAAALSVDGGMVPGQGWTLAPERLQSADGLVIDLARATVWQPGSGADRIDPATLRAGLDLMLERLAGTALPEDGLIRLALPDAVPLTPVEKAAAPALSDLRGWLISSVRGAPTAIPDRLENLIGLGPGLTPSGDDLLGGVLITLHQLGERRTAELLGEAIGAVAGATNRISRAHLRAAMRGCAAAPLHDLLHASLITGRRSPRRALDAAAKIGHSSGLDAIAGMVLALQSHLAARA